MFITAASGVGKSVLGMQLAIYWALARSTFGICPSRELKSLYFQAENDCGDLAEMYQGIYHGIGITGMPLADQQAIHAQIKERVILVNEGGHTGEGFLKILQRRIDRHKPDIIWVDPFLSFFGGNPNDQESVAAFLRHGVNPVLKASGAAIIFLHHTGKTSSDPKSRKNWTTGDYSYAGIGHSDMTNWARASAYFHAVDEQSFRLLITKRGRRAGALDLQGQKTTEIFLRHSGFGLFWEQIDRPEPPDEDEKPRVRKSTPGKVHRPFDVDGFLNSIAGEFFKVTQLFQRAQDYGECTNGQFYGNGKHQGLLQELKDKMELDKETTTWVYRKSPAE